MNQKIRLPLLKDNHNHVLLYATLAHCHDLGGVSKPEALSLLKRGGSSLNLAIGWNDSIYRFEREELDELPPAVIFNVSLHSYVINSAAAELIAPEHAPFIDNAEDTQWVEKNISGVLNFLMSLNPCDTVKLRGFYDSLLSLGIWHAEEMSLKDEAELKLFSDAGLMDRSAFWAETRVFEALGPSDQALVRGIKLFTDGALGARSAALSEPFLTGERGMLTRTDQELAAGIERALEYEKEVAIHAIGDLATDQVISVLENLKRKNKRIPEARIEHCQFISKDNAKRAKALGLTLSMQPNFNTDSTGYRDRISRNCCVNNNPFRMLIDEAGFTPGQDLIFGSDGMPHGAAYALASSLFPPYDGQKLSIEEFMAGYCMQDMEKGSVELRIDVEKRQVSVEDVSSAA